MNLGFRFSRFFLRVAICALSSSRRTFEGVILGPLRMYLMVTGSPSIYSEDGP